MMKGVPQCLDTLNKVLKVSGDVLCQSLPIVTDASWLHVCFARALAGCIKNAGLRFWDSTLYSMLTLACGGKLGRDNAPHCCDQRMQRLADHPLWPCGGIGRH